MINEAINPEPNLQFSQARTCIIQNYKRNSFNLQNVIIYLHQGVWGQKTSFERALIRTFPPNISEV